MHRNLNNIQLIAMLEQLKNADRIEALINLGADILKSIINDEYKLFSVVLRLPKTDRLSFLHLLGSETLKSLIQNEPQWLSIVNRLPKADRQKMVDLVGYEIINQKKINSNFFHRSYDQVKVFLKTSSLERDLVIGTGIALLATITTALFLGLGTALVIGMAFPIASVFFGEISRSCNREANVSEIKPSQGKGTADIQKKLKVCNNHSLIKNQQKSENKVKAFPPSFYSSKQFIPVHRQENRLDVNLRIPSFKKRR